RQAEAADLAADRADAEQVRGDRDAARQDRLAAAEDRAKAAEAREAAALLGLTTRNVIGQAQGLLMARFNITADEAFSRLVAESQRRNVKLHSIAAEHVDRHHS
ncbi:MAG: hypothetical protein JWN57_1780, partial [Frankiales bacterium]|nr:hypothetical protein [Frankiales bacterium]